jgi:hypothetical protein
MALCRPRRKSRVLSEVPTAQVRPLRLASSRKKRARRWVRQRAGAEVLAVGQHHHHAVRVGEATGVDFSFAGNPPKRQAQALAGPPNGDAVEGLVDADDVELFGST